MALTPLLALLVSGCASLSPPEGLLPLVAVPPAWAVSSGNAATSGAATALARWWTRFDDPQLTALVEQSLNANTSVRTAQASLQQARAQVDVQSAGLAPSVGASGSAQRSRANSSTGNTFQAGFDASWEPDVFGRLRSGVNASEADARAAEASLADVQVSLAAEVAVNYIELRGLQQRLAIARSNLASQQETLQIAQWRLQAGLTTSLVTEQARAAAEQTAAQIPSLEASLAQSRYSLAVLTGQAPGALDATLAASAPVPQPTAELALAIPAETLRQRPDVRVAEQRIAAALARVLQADAARYPSFSLGGSLGLRALTLGGLSGGGAVTSALLGSVSIPLLDGGAARAQVRVQSAALEQARVAYEATVLAALQDVENALVALRGDRERLTRLVAAADAANNAALLAQQRYSSGLIDFQSVLETQRTLLSTQESVATTTAAVAADHVRLYKALGGGWQPTP
ncbi:MAG: efflux transporter outer membrane subunit [Acidovorax sp.]|uniref:efflux transporter outer membrane subunit n=1 Tax=Acidovorax sp. TaxID=1872122 RepID=UPI00261414E5|nr:efflux transporter outer membrane subunit [Acidovorax sp.]MDH4416104.1 efflux transporter outer membrane subunit [Acidovorax sp.]